jgi:carboxyl-terminal processing protease
MRRSALAVLVLVLAAAAPGARGETRDTAPPRPAAERADLRRRAEAFESVWRLVAERFFDPALRGVDWDAARDRYQAPAAAAADERGFASVVNEMLAELGSSHTRYYTDRDPEYYFLRGVFREGLRQPIPDWDDPGFVAVRTSEGLFVRDVLDGGPAAAAGVRVGDRVVERGAAFDPVETFEGRSGRPVPLLLRSEPGGPVRRVEVVPRRTSGQRAYLDATRASVRRLPLPGVGGEAGYIRLWALSHPLFLEALEGALARLEGARGLVLDLRGGFGGRSEDYLDLFLRGGTGRIETVDRRGERRPFFTGWDAPVVALIDGGTRSAKELLAYSLRRAGRARLVGARTAGAVLASNAYPIGDRALLLLPVADLVVDGQRLEGRGVEPDVAIDVPLPYRNGADPQLGAALSELAALAAGRRDPPQAGP